jgi:arginine decarboxylase-like protein
MLNLVFLFLCFGTIEHLQSFPSTKSVVLDLGCHSLGCVDPFDFSNSSNAAIKVPSAVD